MELEVIRFSSGTDSTNGILLETIQQGNEIDGIFKQKKFLAYTLEDEQRSEKIIGETRIPNGTFELGLRKVGGYHARYSKRFPHIHIGMLHVLDVPGFEYILIQAYKRIYPRIAEAIECGEKVTITYKTI